MRFRYTADAWCTRYRRCESASDRLKLIDPPIMLAADVLGVTRIRVHQLIKEGKLDSISVYDDVGHRIGHFVTQASLDRRRRYRYKRGQWRPGDGRVVHRSPSA